VSDSLLRGGDNDDGLCTLLLRVCCEECETLGVGLIEEERGIDRRRLHSCLLGCWHGGGRLGACAFACEVARLTWVGLRAPYPLRCG